MSLVQPVLLSTGAFDATKPHDFIFNIVGGPQIRSNKLIIKDNATGKIVYEKTQQTYDFKHTYDGNSPKVINGGYYNATITVYDKNNTPSPESNPIQFYCYTTPTITFTNIPSDTIIENASFNFAFTYNQNEKESLSSYKMNLYNSSKELISSSGQIYTNDESVPYTSSYLFSGFENNTVYYIELLGKTVENTSIKTELIEITAKYEEPSIFSLVEINNNCKEGYVTIKSNLEPVNGDSYPDPPRYIGNNQVDLSDEKSWVAFNKGYSFSDDFLLSAWFRFPPEIESSGKNYNKPLIMLSNTKGEKITLVLRKGYENKESTQKKVYIDVFVKSTEGTPYPYYIFSNYINEIFSPEGYNVRLKRINNIYQVGIKSTQ